MSDGLTGALLGLGRPVAYYPRVTRWLGGDIAAAVFVCQFVYWRGRVGDREIYKTRAEIEEETAIGPDAQKRICRMLTAHGYVEIVKKGIPARNFYRWDWDKVDADFARFVRTSACESHRLVRANPTDKTGGIPPTTTETTTETTSDTLPPPTPASADADVVSPPETFSAWWAIYPRRVGKKAAERKYRTALREGATVEQLLDGARRMRTKVESGTALKYIPHPATWLNQGRWEDEEGGDEDWKTNLTEWERDALL